RCGWRQAASRWRAAATPPPGSGSATPMDARLDAAEATVTVGVRELACRLNPGSRGFDKGAENLARAAQVVLSRELFRQVVEAEGRAVLAAQRSGTLTISWTADDCRIPTATPAAARAAARGRGRGGGPPPAAPRHAGVPGVRRRQGAPDYRRGETGPPPPGQAATAALRQEAAAATEGQAGDRPALQGV